MSADLEKLYRAASANADSRELNLLQQVRELGHYPTRLGANALAAASAHAKAVNSLAMKIAKRKKEGMSHAALQYSP